MTTFQDRIKNTLTRVMPREEANQGPTAPFDQVLEEFVETLMAEWPFVGAAIEKKAQPPMRSFITWPRLRRDERSIMLTFWWEGTAMKVLNDTDRPLFKTPEELSDYLINFLEKSAFPATLAEYEIRCKESVDGFLRTKSLIDMSPDDVGVLVGVQDQQALVKASPGSTLNLTVEWFPASAEYSEGTAYRCLASGGFGLRIISHGRTDAKIQLCGEVMGPEETT